MPKPSKYLAIHLFSYTYDVEVMLSGVAAKIVCFFLLLFDHKSVICYFCFVMKFLSNTMRHNDCQK